MQMVSKNKKNSANDEGVRILRRSGIKATNLLGKEENMKKRNIYVIYIGTTKLTAFHGVIKEDQSLTVERFIKTLGQEWRGDQRVILFVKLAEGHSLTDELQAKIKKTLRDNASPRHVPARILEVPDIPYTLNMKKVESAVTNIIHGRPVSNRDALTNPESLDYYESLLPELQKA